MNKRKKYIQPDARIILVETQGVMADYISNKSTDNTGNEDTSSTEIPNGGHTDTPNFSKDHIGGGLWDFEDGGEY